jgi:hypothetical protein
MSIIYLRRTGEKLNLEKKWGNDEEYASRAEQETD